MGLNPFWLVIEYIPVNAKYIYIVTESNKHGHWCHDILQALRNDIQSKFPRSYVIIRKGGQYDYIFVLLSMFTQSGVFIASPSTLSFFAALSNVNGKIFLPRKTFYGNSFNCCKNLETMSHSPICIWRNKISGELTPIEKITSTQMIETLRNETYINFYPTMKMALGKRIRDVINIFPDPLSFEYYVNYVYKNIKRGPLEKHQTTFCYENAVSQI